MGILQVPDVAGLVFANDRVAILEDDLPKVHFRPEHHIRILHGEVADLWVFQAGVNKHHRAVIHRNAVVFQNVPEHGAVLATAEREVDTWRAVILPADVVALPILIPAFNTLGCHLDFEPQRHGLHLPQLPFFTLELHVASHAPPPQTAGGLIIK